VPDYEGELGIGKLAVDDVQVGAAVRARLHPNALLTFTRGGRRDVAQHERRALSFEEHGSHEIERSVRVKFFYAA
jgi:hypothetical protein